MLKRIISAAVGIAVFILVLLVSDKISFVFNIAVSILSAIAVGELFFAKKLNSNKPILVCGIVFAAVVPFLITPYFGNISSVACFVYIVVLLAIMIFDHKNITVEQMGLSFMFSTLVPFAFSTLIYIKDYYLNDSSFNKKDSMYVLIMACAGAWIADTGAYFTGRLLGRHKLSPEISPKKTVEGLIGGVVFNTVIFVVGGIIYQNYISDDASVNIILCGIIGLFTAFMGTLGDLSASFVKRSSNVKDYGNIMPGHGGVMDRFDSVLLVAPTVYFLVVIFQTLWPLIIR